MLYKLPGSRNRKIPMLVNIDPITECRSFVNKTLRKSVPTFSRSTSSGKFNTAKEYNTSAHCLISNFSEHLPILNAKDRIKVVDRFFLALRVDNTYYKYIIFMHLCVKYYI